MEKDILRQRFATEEEKQKLFQAIKDNGYKWNSETKTLEKLVKPKFKVGDRIQWHDTHANRSIRVIKSLECNRYRLDNGKYIKFGDEHFYKLLKFDITTLKTFDKVLVRDTKEQVWVTDLFSHAYNRLFGGYLFTCIGHHPNQCIPYNKDTKYLVGTTNDCDEFYKTWEK